MKSISYRGIEPIVEGCFKTAKTILEHIPKERGLVTNKNNETFNVGLTDFYAIAKKLFSFAAVFRGNGQDYSYLGYTESVLESILAVENPKRSFHDPSEECTVESNVFQTALRNYWDTSILLVNLSNEGLIITNSKGEAMHFTLSYISEIASDLLGIVVAYRGDADDYSNLAYVQSNLKVHNNQIITNYERIIHNYQQAVKLGVNNPNSYNNLSRHKHRLADLLSNKQTRESLYSSAVEDGKKAVIIRLKNNALSDCPYYNRGYSYLKLAQLSEDRNERIGLCKRAIANSRKACRLHQDEDNYFLLAESEENLAKEFYLTDKAKKLKQEALADYKIALNKVNNPIIRGRIRALEQSL